VWLNLGDSYSQKNLQGMPWRVAFALQDDGWTLRNAIVWNKPNGMPSNVKDRLATRYEQIFLLTKSGRYFFDLDPIRVPYTGDRKASRRARTGHTNKSNSATGVWGVQSVDAKGRNPGDVWDVSTRPFKEAHFATFPVDIPNRCILAGCKAGGVVLDPFSGSGTTGVAALQNGRSYIGIDINREYLDLSLSSGKRFGGSMTFE
jgi:DNA modification methylase